MPYVIRDHQGEITALLKHPAVGAEEYLAADTQEVVDFLSPQGDQDAHMALAESDKDIARVTEDLIHLLIAKNTILFTDLPEAVQQKLLNREHLRHALPGSIDNFLDSDESI